jgi:PAS domain S-box-containing protein
MRILVVEDDEQILQALITILTHQNYAVEAAIDGQAGWNLIETFDYDLILLDVRLPKLDGISLCRQIRARGLSMPILLLTAQDNSHDKAIGLDAGADDYVVKPFDVEELVARIRALLRRGGTVSQPVLEWDQLRLDPISCEVTYQTKLLMLTPKEYAMMELFLRNSRRVFSCGMILEHLWAYDEMPGEEAVRTHIKGLRQKLKSAGATGDLVETVYGIGYRLKPLSGEQKNEVVADTIRRTTIEKIAGVWQRFQGRVEQQVLRLEQAAEAAIQDSLTEEVRSQSKQDAHSLTGALGMFGLPEGSNLARQIEAGLSRDLGPDQAKILQIWVQTLRQEIETFSAPASTTIEQPLVLVIDRDPLLTEQLIQESANWELRTAIAPDLTLARKILYHDHPSIVLLDPTVCDAADSLTFLTELHQRKPPVPVIVFSAQADLSYRLQVARQGRQTFLPKPILPAQVWATVMQVLRPDAADTKVLAVDDDPKVLMVLQSLLEPWGLTVTPLNDARQFWETLETVSPDLLILDVEMPDVNGLELCQVVREDARWSELPIVFLTAHSDAAMVNQMFAIGADDFVSKPIVGAELVTRIVNRLERKKMLQRMVKTPQTIRQEPLSQPQKDLVEQGIIERAALRKLNQQLQSELDDRQRTQAALQISQARLAGILDIADDAIIAIDAHQQITLFNQGAEKIFGYSAGEIMGQSLDRLLPIRFAERHRQHVQEFAQSSQEARRMGDPLGVTRRDHREIYGRRKDGSDFPAEASISKFMLAGETVFTVILRDITELVRVEDERKQIERMKDEFVSIVSHELRTPLTSIHGSLGMLSSGLLKADSDAGKRLLQIAVDSTDRLVRLINDILDIERIESGRVKMDRHTCNLSALIDEAVDVMQPIAHRANVTLSITNLTAEVWVDRDRMVQTLTNLLSNAIKFSSSGSTVWLTAALTPGAILLQVKDQGRGIPAEKLGCIFERFQQVDSSDSRNCEGTGLGLAICQSIVQQHGGEIWVESGLGEGSTVYLTVPLQKCDRPCCE